MNNILELSSLQKKNTPRIKVNLNRWFEPCGWTCVLRSSPSIYFLMYHLLLTKAHSILCRYISHQSTNCGFGLPVVRSSATRGRLLFCHSLRFPGDAASSLQSKREVRSSCVNIQPFPRGGVALLLTELIFTWKDFTFARFFAYILNPHSSWLPETTRWRCFSVLFCMYFFCSCLLWR